jgi:hypothetical protein
MPLHSDRRATLQSAKIAPPAGLRQEALRTASPCFNGQPARCAQGSLPKNFLPQSRWCKLMSSRSKFMRNSPAVQHQARNRRGKGRYI